MSGIGSRNTTPLRPATGSLPTAAGSSESGPRVTSGDDSAEAHTTDLLDVIRRLDAGPAHLVGFSTAIALRAILREPSLVRSLTIIEPNLPWLLEGDPDGEATLAWWRAENDRVQVEAGGDETRRAKLWFELVNNRGPGTFDAQPEGLRRMWLDNFGAPRPTAPPPEPITCAQLGRSRPRRWSSVPSSGCPTHAGSSTHSRVHSRKPNLLIIGGVTHFMSYQDPDPFNEAVLAFIAGH